MEFLAPVITLVFYAVDAKLRGNDALDATKAFTSLAIINLVSRPAMNILGTFPRFATIMGSAKRVQKYLLEPCQDDQRRLINPDIHAGASVGSVSDDSPKVQPAIRLDGVFLRPTSSADICLQDLDISMSPGTLNIICGPVG